MYIWRKWEKWFIQYDFKKKCVATLNYWHMENSLSGWDNVLSCALVCECMIKVERGRKGNWALCHSVCSATLLKFAQKYIRSSLQTQSILIQLVHLMFAPLGRARCSVQNHIELVCSRSGLLSCENDYCAKRCSCIRPVLWCLHTPHCLCEVVFNIRPNGVRWL